MSRSRAAGAGRGTCRPRLTGHQTPTERLAALIADCAAAGVARQALLCRLDRLPPALSRPHHHRLAEAALAPLLGCPRAELFHLPGPRLAVTWRGDAEAALLDVVDALDHLLTDSAVPAPTLFELVFLYDLPSGGELLLAALADDTPALPEPPAPEPPLDPACLMLLEAMLAQADLTRFARRETIWRLGPGPPCAAWERRTLCLAELGAELLPGRDLAGDPWLLRRLTRTLDRRKLALLSSPGELAQAGPFVLDLNVSSVLGPEFLRFDAALPPGLRGRVALSLSPADIVADAAAFAFARGFARARDYRIMLRDATPDLLSVLPASALGVDYLVVPWAADLPHTAAPLLDACPADALLLDCGDAADAFAWGRSVGIHLFTGPAADWAAVGASLGERVAAA